MAKEESTAERIVFTLLGLNDAGQKLLIGIFILGFAGFMAYTVLGSRSRFSDADEHLFRAARHGDLPGIEQSLGEGAAVTDVSPVDGKTALHRAAILGQTAAVRLLLERGADPAAHGFDGQTPLEIVQAARAPEKDAAAAKALDAIAELLRGHEGAK